MMKLRRIRKGINNETDAAEMESVMEAAVKSRKRGFQSHDLGTLHGSAVCQIDSGLLVCYGRRHV
jgi:hypothetical protein